MKLLLSCPFTIGWPSLFWNSFSLHLPNLVFDKPYQNKHHFILFPWLYKYSRADGKLLYFLGKKLQHGSCYKEYLVHLSFELRNQVIFLFDKLLLDMLVKYCLYIAVLTCFCVQAGDDWQNFKVLFFLKGIEGILWRFMATCLKFKLD